jgi:hypothetical protein
MKAILIVMSFVLITLSLNSLAQTNQDFDRVRQRMKLREEAHRRMREKILFGRGSDDDLFKDLDKMFSDMMNDDTTFEPRPEFALGGSSYTSEWKSDSNGKTLILTPKDPSVQLDINVKDQYITIGAKQEIKDQNSQIESSTSSVIPVPYECDGGKVQMKSVDKSVHLIFPFKTGGAVQNKKITLPKKKNGDQNDRRPINPSSSDVEI